MDCRDSDDESTEALAALCMPCRASAMPGQCHAGPMPVPCHAGPVPFQASAMRGQCHSRPVPVPCQCHAARASAMPGQCQCQCHASAMPGHAGPVPCHAHNCRWLPDVPHKQLVVLACARDQVTAACRECNLTIPTSRLAVRIRTLRCCRRMHACTARYITRGIA
jgi:hypothetical protein